MEEILNNVLRGLVTYNVGIFIVLTLGILVYARKFLIGLREWQKAVFGLERTLAERKLVGATTGMTLLILLIIGEFLVITVVGPRLPSPEADIGINEETFETVTGTPPSDEGDPTPVPTATVGQVSLIFECIEGVIEITYPEDGGEVSGTVELMGSVNVEGFGSYKYEYSTTGAINWTTIAAGNSLKLDESLGFWYTSSLVPGNYLLQLVPLDNTGEELTPCIIGVEVVSEE